MKELFSYTRPGYKFSTSQIMVLKLGKDYAAFVITEPSGNELYSLTYCSFSGLTVKSLEAFIDAYPVFENNFKKIKLVYDIPGNTMLPYADPADIEMISNAHILQGNLSTNVISIGGLEGWQIRNSFALPAGDVDAVIQDRLQAVEQMHLHDVFIRCLGPGIDEGELIVDFKPDQFVVVARRRSQVLFARHFEYETPTDVLYYLLRIAEQFSLSPNMLALRLSGLIDQNSALYNELYQYFIHIIFREADWGAIEDFPAHFFTTFNDVAKCVS